MGTPQTLYRGSMVAIVTPFKEGVFEATALEHLIDFQLSNGTVGIVPCGTTGESATMSHEEHRRVVEVAVKAVGGRIPVIAGTGSNSTDEAIDLTRHAKQVGADAALLITPYYNKPTQEGLFLHYKRVAESVDLPLILYNIPGRTAVNMLPETVERLCAVSNVVAIKEGSGSLQQISDVVRRCGDRMPVLSGDDALTLPILAVGGTGVITVSANIIPKEVSTMIDAFNVGNIDQARQGHLKMDPLVSALFLETNPIPVKQALAFMGKMSAEVRLPLCRMSDENQQRLRQVMTTYGLL
ncbi:MAG: 4-hydroxy-tetrahydrodipicolinate synthase [Nitrospiraceae bacterium]|nr:4-hydroxy-tetrahydrodipicolinate synthase [Nitrospiraceae bacterium]